MSGLDKREIILLSSAVVVAALLFALASTGIRDDGVEENRGRAGGVAGGEAVAGTKAVAGAEAVAADEGAVEYEARGAVLVNGVAAKDLRREKLVSGDLVETGDGEARLEFERIEVRLGRDTTAAISGDCAVYVKKGRVLATGRASFESGEVFLLTSHIVARTISGPGPVIRVGVDELYGSTVKVDQGVIRVENRTVSERLGAGEGITVSSSGKVTALKGESLVFGESRDFLEEPAK